MTMTTPWRRMTLHFSQIALTLGRTFISLLSISPGRPTRSLVAVRDSPSTQVIRCDFHLHAIAGADADPVHPHLARAVCQNLVAVLKLHPEHGVGQRLDHCSLEHDRILFGLWQVTP